MIDFELIDKIQDIITIVAIPIATILLIWILIEVKQLREVIL